MEREQYSGIDLHKGFFQACAVTPTGERSWEGRFPRRDAGIAAFLTRCSSQVAIAVRTENLIPERTWVEGWTGVDMSGAELQGVKRPSKI